MDIIAGFRKTGIYPLSKESVPPEKLFPSEIFREDESLKKDQAIKGGKHTLQPTVLTTDYLSTTDADGEDFLFANFQQTNLWAPTGNAEDANCLEILQQQSEPISRTNKLFIS